MKDKKKLKFYITLALIYVFLAVVSVCLMVFFPDSAPGIAVVFSLLISFVSCDVFDIISRGKKK